MRPVARIAQSVEQGLKIPVSLVRFRVRAPLFIRPRCKAGFFLSGYGRFLVVATGYLFAGFLAIFADIRYF